jgi:hypothetical protein
LFFVTIMYLYYGRKKQVATMKYLFFYSFLFLLSLASYSQDFRNASWGDSPEKVKANEKGALLSEKTEKNRHKNLSFVEFSDSSFYYTYTYVFHELKLIGVIAKRAYLYEENSKYKALNIYKETLDQYQAKYEKIYEGAPLSAEEIKGFQVKLPDKTIYVSVKKENNDYFLTESIFQRASKAK